MRNMLIVLAVFGVGIAPCRGQEGTGMAAPAQATDQTRDPFWPVGYVPAKEEAVKKTEVVKTEKIEWPELTIKILDRGGHAAMLDPGGWVRAGQTLQIVRGGVVYAWKIGAITDDGVEQKRLEPRPAKASEVRPEEPKIIIHKGGRQVEPPADK